MAAGAKPERTNRWLLIGAAALAVLAGVLVFALLANSGDNSSKSTPTGVGEPSDVLVAKNTIAANTRITADMFDRVNVQASTLVVNPVSDVTTVVGKVTRSEILKNQQLSFDQIGLSRGGVENQLTYSVTVGKRAMAVPVSEAKSVAGLIVPDDRVDVVLTFKEKRTSGDPNATDITRVETVLQNVKLLAFAQETVVSRPTLDAQGTPIANPTADIGARPTDTKANPGAGTATLELTPQEVQTLVAALSKGELTLVLRAVGDDQVQQLAPTFEDDNGLLPGRP